MIYMKKIFKTKSGFTLIEMLVAMAIFVVFVGILVNSYSSIVKAYHEANDYRKMYVEARDIFETLTRELRDGMVDYEHVDYSFSVDNNNPTEWHFISKDARYRTDLKYNNISGELRLIKSDLNPGSDICIYYTPVDADGELLNPNIGINNFNLLISPVKDPYDDANVYLDTVQFQPMVTIYAEFEFEGHSFELQTSLSSRIYNQICETK